MIPLPWNSRKNLRSHACATFGTGVQHFAVLFPQHSCNHLRPLVAARVGANKGPQLGRTARRIVPLIVVQPRRLPSLAVRLHDTSQVRSCSKTNPLRKRHPEQGIGLP